MNPTHYNDMQLVKRRFFAMRNGVVADSLRRAGSPYPIIFGVNLPQIREIASQFEPSADLARRLWADGRTRESALLAPWLIPGRQLSESGAAGWLRSASSAEAVDVLCMACLRGADYAFRLAAMLIGSARELDRYAALRLALNNLTPCSVAGAEAIVSSVSDTDSPAIRRLAAQVADELTWISGS